MKFKEAISLRIYELCDLYNYIPNRLAELSATPPTTLRALLSNKVENPSTLIIFRICKTFNIEVKEFFNSDLFKLENIDD